MKNSCQERRRDRRPHAGSALRHRNLIDRVYNPHGLSEMVMNTIRVHFEAADWLICLSIVSWMMSTRLRASAATSASRITVS